MTTEQYGQLKRLLLSLQVQLTAVRLTLPHVGLVERGEMYVTSRKPAGNGDLIPGAVP